MTGKRIIGRDHGYVVVIKDDREPNGYRRVTGVHSNRTAAIAEYVWNWQRVLFGGNSDVFRSTHHATLAEMAPERQQAWRKAQRTDGACTVQTVTEWRAPGA